MLALPMRALLMLALPMRALLMLAKLMLVLLMLARLSVVGGAQPSCISCTAASREHESSYRRWAIPNLRHGRAAGRSGGSFCAGIAAGSFT